MKFSLDWKNPLALLPQETALKRMTAVVNTVLVAILAFTFASLTWQLLPAPESAAPPPSPTQSAAGTAASGLNKSRNIAAMHLFGQKSTAVTAVVPTQEIKETTLNLVLRGVFSSDDQGSSGAIIAEPNGNEKYYAVEARLPGGAILKEIHPDHIILMRSGRLETLRLPQESIDLKESDLASLPTATAPAIGEQMNMREFRQVLMNQPQRLADMVQMEPVAGQDGLTGYRLRPGRDPGLFNRFGLEEGDVVTAINGIALDSPAKGLNVLRSLGNVDEVRVDVLRNGTPQSFVVNMNN